VNPDVIEEPLEPQRPLLLTEELPAHGFGGAELAGEFEEDSSRNALQPARRSCGSASPK
jgi:hypothetical protein